MHAINVDVTLNRYLDHDPSGVMYALAADIERVREEERRNAEARAGRGEPAVTHGLQGDAIQPLTLRVNQGDCLRIRLHNGLEKGDASLHVHGSALRVAGTRKPAVANEPLASAPRGGVVDYEWQVPADEPEATHYFHSHGDTRRQTSHGLFGALVVEPRGSEHVDPRTGAPGATGWDAIIRAPGAVPFREFVVYYHEIGDETFGILDRAGDFVPQVDPLTRAYRPDGRALNYRSEPFVNRLSIQRQLFRRFDESTAYSSYAFGDPATPVLRSYLGERTKQRVVHGGSEVPHVHHVHGGAIRWRRQEGVDPPGKIGLDKAPPLRPTRSERTDSQSLGPSESYDEENECGAGGCQQSVGDFLLHCHIAHHYFAGMWGVWRVYNTRQNGVRSTDGLPPLLAVNEATSPAVAVPAASLAGTTVSWHGQRYAIDRAGLTRWVQRQLPPRGTPGTYDASVWDWSRVGERWYGEPETTRRWPGYTARAPGKRPELLFDPRTGKLAYPFLRPHLGQRPPFAPGHGPAPYLDPGGGTDPPLPGANGPGSTCPGEARVRSFDLRAVSVPVPINAKHDVVDPGGQLFALAEDLPRLRRNPSTRIPLALRANAQQDCVDVTLANELPSLAETVKTGAISKVNAHIHFVQFDVQASDGVVAGFNYEQAVRPFREVGTTLAARAAVGATRVRLRSVAGLQPGVFVGVGMTAPRYDVRRVVAVHGSTVAFDRPLTRAAAAGDWVSVEFVRYRWFPDVQFGTAYFHDHVNAIQSWRHGLFGALVAEPPGATYHDPYTGAEVRSGLVADVHTDQPVSRDVRGSFRELVTFLQDDNPLAHARSSTGSSVNLRAESLKDRGGEPAELFSSTVHGDPATPVLEANLGDPVVLRTLVGGTNEVHSWHVDGHWFRPEPWSDTSSPASTMHVGISERVDLVLPRAGGPQRRAGDYLMYGGRALAIEEGTWGLLRVRGAGEQSALRTLPGRPAAAPPTGSVCPAGARRRRFDVAAVDLPAALFGARGARGKAFVLADRPVPNSATIDPLVLHVTVGDCVEVTLVNRTTDGAVTLHCDLLAADPRDSAGVSAGRNPHQAVAKGATRTYTFFASPEVGAGVSLIRDFGDALRNTERGLYGAIVVSPRGSVYRDPATGRRIGRPVTPSVIVDPPSAPPYRDFTLLLHDSDETIGTHRMPYNAKPLGATGINYASAPLARRARNDAGPGRVFDAKVHGDPATPVLHAVAGDPLRLHVLAPWSVQPQVFTVEGHRWRAEPDNPASPFRSSQLVVGGEAVTLRTVAGGPERLVGDFVYGDHREPMRDAGMWGLLRVTARPQRREVAALVANERPWAPYALALAGLLAAGGALWGVRSLRSRP